MVAREMEAAVVSFSAESTQTETFSSPRIESLFPFLVIINFAQDGVATSMRTTTNSLSQSSDGGSVVCVLISDKNSSGMRIHGYGHLGLNHDNAVDSSEIN